MKFTKFIRNNNNPKRDGKWIEVIDVRRGQMPPFKVKRPYVNYYECISDGETYVLLCKRKDHWDVRFYDENGNWEMNLYYSLDWSIDGIIKSVENRWF